MLMNDYRINTNYSPDKQIILDVVDACENLTPPLWVTEKLTNFKRNFHVLERIGIFERSQQREGLQFITQNLDLAYSYANIISEMTYNFTGFEACYKSSNKEDAVSQIITTSIWAEYYDALTMPMQILTSLTSDFNIEEVFVSSYPIGTVVLPDQQFPELHDYQTNQVRAFTPSGNKADPFETIIRREKANREHGRILNMLAALLRTNGFKVYENTFIDLYADIDETPYIFEVKSNNAKNVLSQIRKAIAQLYEYRYRSSKHDATLCIVLQQQPPQSWVIDYLVNDRKILLCWLVDDIRLECPEDCYTILSEIGIVN
jgi:CRISPR/Cas system CSM-associated protein Csm2 small subunit